MPLDREQETEILRQRAAQAFRPVAGEPTPFDEGPGWRVGVSRQISLQGFRCEAELADAVVERLAPWFHITREVSGRHPTGARCRIDAVLSPRDAQQWKDPDVALGLEFKAWQSHIAESDRRDTTGWVAQAIDYAHVEWHGQGRLPVFMCPDPFEKERVPGGAMPPVAQFVDGLLGQYNVGFLALHSKTGFTMTMHGHHMVWSERYGVQHGRRWRLRPRTGHRS